MYKLANYSLKFSTSREFFILVNVFLIIFNVFALKFIIPNLFLDMTELQIEKMTDVIDGIASMLVGLGVLMECREIIRDMIHSKHNILEEYLNKVGEHNGVGLLIIGLLIEILTLMIYIPNEFIDTSGIETYFFSMCVLLIVVSILVSLDLVKDYIISYFNK